MEGLIAASKAVFANSYNPLSWHPALDDMTPARAADSGLSSVEVWADLVTIATRNRTA